VGETPFLRAALSADLAAMQLLLEHGADANLATAEGTTPLMAAAGIDWVDGVTYIESDGAPLAAVKLCVKLGANLEATNREGFTALHGAANRGSDDIIAYLVSIGANLNAKDKVGRTPLTFAEGVFLGAKTQVNRPKTAELIRRLLEKPENAGDDLAKTPAPRLAAQLEKAK
jgi:ankyrin repeat protein